MKAGDKVAIRTGEAMVIGEYWDDTGSRTVFLRDATILHDVYAEGIKYVLRGDLTPFGNVTHACEMITHWDMVFPLPEDYALPNASDEEAS